MRPRPVVRIVQLSAPTLAALAVGDLAAANQLAEVRLTPYFVEPNWRGTWQRRAAQVVSDPTSQPWITGVVWDIDNQVAVGRAGFHGPPDSRGMVEVGYAIDPDFRRRGYARAALEYMLTRAAEDPQVSVVRATISPDNDASRSLIAAYDFAIVGDQWDDEDGLEIIYERAASRSSLG